jgi:hypothetical protein
MKKITIFLLGTVFFYTLQNPAKAALIDEIQVYDGEINQPGEFGLEIHLNATPNGSAIENFNRERLSDRGVRVTPEFTYGLTKTFELGFYLPMIYTPQYGFEVAGYKPRLKWMPLQSGENNPWSLGVNLEYAQLKTGMDESNKSAEARFIAAWESKDWLFAFNPILDKKLSKNKDETPDLNIYGSALLQHEGLFKSMGLEYYQTLGPYRNFLPSNEQAKQLFLVGNTHIEHGFLKDWDIHFGAGYGWDSADRFTVKMIVSPKL